MQLSFLKSRRITGSVGGCHVVGFKNERIQKLPEIFRVLFVFQVDVFAQVAE
jgi:hypothetical protein